MSRPDPRGALGAVLLGTLAVVLGLLALAAAGALGPGSTDDLFVVLVYARNLLELGAPVHELGEGRLEGFTSPLDLGLKTLALALGPGDGVRSAWIATTTVYVLALLASARAAWVLSAGGGRGPRLLGAAALALCAGVAEGTTYLLETPLVVLLLAGLAVGVSRRLRRPRAWCAGLATMALVLARPELGLVALAWCWPAGSDREEGRWRPLVAAGLALVLVAALRWMVFGRWLPNSFHAKASDSRLLELGDGLRYVFAFLLGEPWGGLPGRAAVVAGAVLAPILARGGPAPVGVLARAAPLALAAVVLSGGDGYAGARLLAPALFLGSLALVGVAGQGEGWRRVTALGMLTVIVLSRAVEVGGQPVTKLKAVASGGLSDESFAGERRALEALARRLPQGATLAVRHLQMAEYFVPELGLLDLTGLNERAVAETPVTSSVGFGRTSLLPALEAQVEVLHLHHQPLSREVLARRSLEDLLAGPDSASHLIGDPLPLPGEAEGARLLARYRTATLLHAGGPGWHLNLLVREDIAEAWTQDAGVMVGSSE